jgi:anti-anti-sigma factor
MKYHIVEKGDLYLIKISGETRKNEAILAKRILFPYLKEKGIKVIMDLKELEKFEPITLLGVLNAIRKEVDLLRGGLKLCSLKPEIINYLKENRLDQTFQIYENKEIAKKSEWRDYGKR